MNATALSVDTAKERSDEFFREATKLHGAGKFEEAEGLLGEALAADPNNGELWNARGVMFAAMERYANAIRCYREALELNPNSSGVWTNLGNALTEVKQLKTAISCHRKAIAISDNPGSLLYHNLGTSLAQATLHGEAIAAFTRALEIKPDYHMARWDRGLSYLHLGNYGLGWTDYETRLVTGQLPARDLPGTKWNGAPYPGQRLIVLVEQGFGDTLWACRYLPRVKALGGELIVECQRELIPIIASMAVADRIIARDDPLPTVDFHCHFCSLPGLFTHNPASIPATPYLTASPDRRAKFQPLLNKTSDRLKVGIVWSGSVTFKKNNERAQRLIRFMQSFNQPGVQLYSLQKGPPQQAVSTLPREARIIDLAPLLDDFSDTAAAISLLDLIIMTDSAVAHLTGAMGKPVWLLLGHVAHWLWMNDRGDCPWYPSLRLFRPRAPGDWDHVFDTAALELMNLLNSRS
jgi:tetratricopeptide (TPR) repeat protein